MEGYYDIDEDQRELHSSVLPSILVLNKVDLVSNKQKFRDL
jgi:hypothetical protein